MNISLQSKRIDITVSIQELDEIASIIGGTVEDVYNCIQESLKEIGTCLFKVIGFGEED